MKYTFVYRDDPRGYCWTVRNNHGLYAAVDLGFGCNGKYSIRRWATSQGAEDYMQIHMREDCVWKPWPDEKPVRIKPVTTAASHKPAHGGYPDAAAAGWASMGTVTGRMRSDIGFITEQAKLNNEPLVWPVVPSYDDGSNEEPTTVPDALVAELSKRHYILVIRH